MARQGQERPIQWKDLNITHPILKGELSREQFNKFLNTFRTALMNL